MITIEKIWLPNKKSHWRTRHAALLAVICLLIKPNIDGFLKIFFFPNLLATFTKISVTKSIFHMPW